MNHDDRPRTPPPSIESTNATARLLKVLNCKFFFLLLQLAVYLLRCVLSLSPSVCSTAGLSSAIYTAAVHHHRLPLEIICTLRNLSERPRSKIIFQSSYRYRLLLSCCTDSSMASRLG